MKRKILFFLFLLVTPISVSSDRTFAEDVVSNDLSLLPKYGGIEKNAAEKAADRDFIASVLKLAGTKEKATEDLIHKGWAALETGDAKTAMRRFNQGWLLMPDNAKVLWGLGAASGELGRFDDSFALLAAASAKDPKDAHLMNDVGLAHLRHATNAAKSEAEAFKDLDEAQSYFKKASEVDPKSDRAFFNMAMVAMYRGDYAQSWKLIKDAEARGGSSIDPRFVKDLETKMPRPAT